MLPGLGILDVLFLEGVSVFGDGSAKRLPGLNPLLVPSPEYPVVYIALSRGLVLSGGPGP